MLDSAINGEPGGVGEVSDPLALTDQEVASRLGLSVATLRAWRRRGVGPRFVRFGRAVRYMPEDVERYVRSSRVETKSVDSASASVIS